MSSAVILTFPVAASAVAPKPTDPDESRRERGRAIAAVTRITQVHGQWVVPSQTGNGSYRVNLNPASPAIPMCSCKDFAGRERPCKHVYAVRAFLEE
jgi:SWIM zinc finger